MRIYYFINRLNSSNKVPEAYDILKIAANGGTEILVRYNKWKLSVIDEEKIYNFANETENIYLNKCI